MMSRHLNQGTISRLPRCRVSSASERHAHQRRDPKMQSLYLAAKAKPKGDDEDEDEDEDDVRRRTRRRTTRRRRMRTTTHESDRRACTKNLSEDLTLVSNTS